MFSLINTQENITVNWNHTPVLDKLSLILNRNDGRSEAVSLSAITRADDDYSMLSQSETMDSKVVAYCEEDTIAFRLRLALKPEQPLMKKQNYF